MNKKRLLFLVVFLTAVLILPTGSIKAAYNDTTLEVDTIIHFVNGGTNGIDIVVDEASTVESFTITDEVGNTKVVFEMDSGSAIHLKSNGRKNFTDSPNAANTDCTSSDTYSTYDYTATSDNYTLTITFSETDNCAVSSGGVSGGGGGGSSTADVSAPIISEIVATPTSGGATITWKTNENSITWVAYGTTASYGVESKTDAYKTTHSVILTGLLPLTTYYYQVKAKDSAGNVSSYAGNTFVTLATGATPPVTTTPEIQPPAITPTTPTATPPAGGYNMKLAQKLKGRLLLQVEQGGAIWYVDTKEYKRYNITWTNALYVFKKLSLGITNANLDKIPISGTKSVGDTALRNKLKGKLLLAVEDRGRVWYVDKDGYRHEVTWANLMDLFRKLALGITNANLDLIPIGSTE